MPARGVGVIELRGESLTPGYLTMGGFIPAQDEHGWYDTGDLGYLTEEGHVVVCGRVKDVIIMAGRNVYPTDIERAAARVVGVRPGCADKDLEARVIDDHGNVMPPRGVGVIELRGECLTPGYLTMGGFIPAQDEHGWYDTGDLGYLTEEGHVVVCGRVKDVIIMAGRNIYPTDIERAAGRVEGVRPGCAVAVRLDAGHSRETFAVAVESNAWQDPVEVRRIEHQVAHEVVAEVDVRPRNVVVLGPGSIPKTPSGKLRRSNSVSLVT